MLWKIGAVFFLLLGVFYVGILVGRRQQRKDQEAAEEVREWLLSRERSCDPRER
jgi:hypothetical protein